MKFTSILAIAVMLFNVEAVKVHSKSKSAAGAHIRRQPKALAQSKAHAKSEFNLEEFMNELKTEADEMMADYNDIEDLIQSGD